MRRFWVLVLFTGLVLGLAPVGAVAQPARERSPAGDEEVDRARVLGSEAAEARHGGSCPLPTPPDEENVDLPPGLIRYHDIAPRLCEIAASSDRVSLEVFGQSAGGRDLYLVTVADPDAGNLQFDLAFRRLMTDNPRVARRVAEANPRLRSPLWVHGSIHGNEWEGVDASIQLIERLALEDDPETQAVLDEKILLFNVVANPDGRVQGTRANANGLDLNRDFATRSQSEDRAVVEQFAKWKPAALYDLHGYVNPMLIEPTTAPHNPNYEYDLFFKWAYPSGQAMQANVAAAGLGIETPDIPYEEYLRGDWDDWPPIFTPQLAAYYGALSHTLEVPLDQSGAAADDPPLVRAERAIINRAAHAAAVWGAFRFLGENAQEVMLDQIEIFRRGDAGEPPASDPFLEPPSQSGGYPSPPGYEADPPEAYVIPAGDSDVAAVRLVNHLLAYGIEVREARRAFTADGVRYERGSFVVDMEQSLRGLANTLLEPGYDLTPVSPQMYDISGWSLGELWGATVVPVEEDVRGRLLRREVEVEVDIPRRAAAYALEVTDPSAIRAINALLDAGVELVRLADGRVLVPGSAYAELVKAAEPEGLAVTALDSVPEGGEPLEPVRVAASTTMSEEVLLRELGFDVTQVDDAALATLSTADYDVLLVSVGSDWADLPPEAQAGVSAFVAAGGGYVGYTFTGADWNAGAAILPVEFAVPETNATPNGVGRVVHPGDSPITAGYAAEDTTFVFAPVWYPVVGEGVRVDERFAAGDFFFAGHWIGQEAAAGQPAIVSGETGSGARAALFGTEPLFRHHPKKLFGQLAQALYWTSVASEG